MRERVGVSAIDAHVISMDQSLVYLADVELPSITARLIKNGQPVLVRHLPAEGLVILYEEEQFIGIGCIDDDDKVARRRLIVTQ